MYSCLREPLGLLSLDIVFWAHRAFKSTNFVLQSMNHIVLVFISHVPGVKINYKIDLRIEFPSATIDCAKVHWAPDCTQCATDWSKTISKINLKEYSASRYLGWI